MVKSNHATPKKDPPPPEDYNQLLGEFVQKSGQSLQKTFVKKLWSVHQDLIDNANPSTLRMMFWSPALTNCPEGIKLVSAILLKIGVVTGMKLLEKHIFQDQQWPITESECQRYGAVFASAWKTANADGDFDVIEELEGQCIIKFCQHSIYHKVPATASKFRKVLSAFALEKKNDKQLDAMLTKMINAVIYQALSSLNHIVQANSAKVLFMFYPLVGDESDDMEKCLETQHKHMADLLSSDVIQIRVDAVKSVLRALTDYWLIIPKSVVKVLMSYIIDTLSRDTVVAVRAAVFEGLVAMSESPNTINVFDHAMRCIASRGLQDKSERVRLVAMQLIARCKNHKFTGVFDVIDRDDPIAKLDTETVEACRRQMIPLMHCILPMTSGEMKDEYYRPRVDYVLAKSRLALLSYFRLLGPMKIIDAQQAARLIEMFITWAYRYLRKKDGPPLSEQNKGYAKARGYLECALVVYMSCKALFLTEEAKKAKCDMYFGKVVKEIFDKYGGTPIIGTATAISSVIPKESLKSIGSDIVARLVDDDVPSEAVEPFLESAIHFNPDSVFDSFDKGLTVLAELFGGGAQRPKAKKRDAGDPEEIMQTTLSRLKYILQSPSTANLMAMRDVYRTRTTDYLMKVDLVREAIEVRLAKPEGVEHVLSDDVLLATLECRFILPLYAAIHGDRGEAEKAAMVESMKALLVWFKERIVEKMSSFEKHNQEFLIELAKTFLECVNVALWSFDFAVVPVEYEDEEDRPEEEEKVVSIGEEVTSVVTSFCNSGTPVELFSPILRVAATICEDSYTECHAQMAQVMRFVPKWINKQCQQLDVDEESPFETDKEPLDALRAFHKRVADLDEWDEVAATRTMHHFVVFSIVWLVERAEEQQCDDPRRDDYIPPHFISFAVVKFIAKDGALTKELLDEVWMDYIQPGNAFLEPEHAEPVEKLLIKLAALAQFLRIVEKNSKFCQHIVKEHLEWCKEKAAELFEENLEGVENHVMNSLSVLLEVELPDGF